jgi:sodium/potassium-transporting ATPase subunit alpha
VLRLSAELGEHEEIIEQHEKIFEIGFNSKNKWMLTLSRIKNSNEATLYVKGAPDFLFKVCTSTVDPEGQSSTIDALSDVIRTQEDWANRGQRVIAICSRKIAYNTIPLHDSDLMEKWATESIRNMQLLSIIGILDPPRKEVPAAVETFKLAGIRVFM